MRPSKQTHRSSGCAACGRQQSPLRPAEPTSISWEARRTSRLPCGPATAPTTNGWCALRTPMTRPTSSTSTTTSNRLARSRREKDDRYTGKELPMSTNALPPQSSLQANDPDPYLQHEHWTRQQLEDYQARALQACREYAYARSPFYQCFHRGRMDRPLQELPVLTKAMLMEHFDEVVTDRTLHLKDIQEYLVHPGGQERFLNRYRVMVTSGSTGQPGVFLRAQAEGAVVSVGLSRFPTWAGVPPGCKVAVIGSTAAEHMSSHLPIAVDGQLLPRLHLSASEPVETLVRQLNEWQPDMVAGYPSMMRVLAEEQRQGQLHIAPRFLVSVSETLTDETRRRVEQTWHTRLFNMYAT